MQIKRKTTALCRRRDIPLLEIATTLGRLLRCNVNFLIKTYEQ